MYSYFAYLKSLIFSFPPSLCMWKDDARERYNNICKKWIYGKGGGEDNTTAKTRCAQLGSQWYWPLVGLKQEEPPKGCAKHFFPHVNNVLQTRTMKLHLSVFTNLPWLLQRIQSFPSARYPLGLEDSEAIWKEDSLMKRNLIKDSSKLTIPAYLWESTSLVRT